MPRYTRHVLVFAAPVVVLSHVFVDSLLEAVAVAQFSAVLLSQYALLVSIRLRWSAPTVMPSARFLAWATVGAAWGVVWSLALAGLAGQPLGNYATGGAATLSIALGSTLVLIRMIRRAVQTARPPKPWTLFV